MDDRVIRSPLLPGGDLIAAVLNREVMSLADRGLASNLVGHRWAELCARHAETWVGQDRPVPDGIAEGLRVRRVEQLDARPEVAAAASRRGLQNPDLLLVGTRHDALAVQAADAKFSIETARAKQVSPEVVTGLLGLRDVVPDLLADVGDAPRLLPGVFLTPDFPLTHVMLRRRQGILRVTVKSDEVVLVPAPAALFFRRLEGATIMAPLASVDSLPIRLDESLLAGLYYFRLARAAVGCWLDATKPLLLYNDAPVVDEGAIRAEAEARVSDAATAYDLILQWNADVQTIRNERAAVEQVAALPMASRELRALVERTAPPAGSEAPSHNQVRRRLGAWYRAQLRDRIGPLSPPVADLPAVLSEIATIGRELAPRLEAEAIRIIQSGADGPGEREAATN